MKTIQKKIILNEKDLYQKYIIENLSKKETAKYFKCSVDTVARNLKEYNIKSHIPSDWMESDIVNLSQHQKDILYGALLGDGSLIKGKNCKNAQFVYTSKSRQHVEFVCKEFLQYSYKEGIKYTTVLDKRTNKEYGRYTYRSISDKYFTEEYDKWYKNNIKHIPDDLILNPTICLIWYIGDGGLINSKNTQAIKLSTHCFLKEEQEKILLPQLSQFNAKLMKAGISKNNVQQYSIYISHNKIKEFLEYIGDCPFDDYAYKWNFRLYKNNPPKQNYKEYEQEICELFKSGLTYYAVAKQLNIEPNLAKYYLIKNNLYKTGG